MTEIVFYSGAADKLNVQCRLCAKALAQNARIMIYSTDTSMLEKIDRQLWAHQQTSFLPHCAIDEDEQLVKSTPIILSNRIAAMQGCSILINLDVQCPQMIEQFDRIIEIAGASPEDKLAARNRYRFYKQTGYALHHHDLTAH
jgi:DNA polymerase-3 subunit chi